MRIATAPLACCSPRGGRESDTTRRLPWNWKWVFCVGRTSLFHPFTQQRTLYYFSFGATMNRDATDVSVQVLCEKRFLILSSEYPGGETVEPRGHLAQNLTSRLAVTGASHRQRWAEPRHNSRHLLLARASPSPSLLWSSFAFSGMPNHQASSQMFICHPHILFSEMSVQIFVHYFIGLLTLFSCAVGVL